MKRSVSIGLALVGCVVALGGIAGERSTSRVSDDEAAIVETVEALYAVISGDAGQERDWDAFRKLFVEEGRLTTFAGSRDEGGNVSRTVRIMTVEDYVTGAKGWFANRSFHERGVHNVVEHFGDVAHVFSTYESLIGEGEADRKPEMRGINSIQLVRVGDEWKVYSILWDSEREGKEIPERYLGGEETQRRRD